jgi:hypothetical protein
MNNTKISDRLEIWSVGSNGKDTQLDTEEFLRTKGKSFKPKKTMLTKDIKDGMQIKLLMDGVVKVSGVMRDNYGTRATRLVDVKGSEVGMFDEMGEIYSFDIDVELTEKQKAFQKQVRG